MRQIGQSAPRATVGQQLAVFPKLRLPADLGLLVHNRPFFQSIGLPLTFLGLWQATFCPVGVTRQ